VRRILIYLLTFPFERLARRRAHRIARERLERLGQSPEDWNRPMSHGTTAHPYMPHGEGDAKKAELNANYVPSWAEPEK
jgi:hypothetical protein